MEKGLWRNVTIIFIMFFIVGISCLSNANENILGQGNLSGSSTVTIWSDASISQEVLVVVNLISGSGDLHVYETNPSSLSYTLRANGAGIFLGIARQIQFAGTSYSTVGSYKVYGPPFPASVQGNLLSGDYYGKVGILSNSTSEFLFKVDPSAIGGQVLVYEDNHSSYNYSMVAGGTGMFLGKAKRVEYIPYNYSTTGTVRLYLPPFNSQVVDGQILSGDYYGKVGILSNSTSEFLFKVDPSAIGGQVLVYEDNHSSYNYSMDADGTAMFLGKAKRIEYIAYTHLLQLQK